MSFFKRLFNKHTDSEEKPKVQFGRYSDAYKSKEQYDAWDISLEKFESEDFLEAFKYFFAYLSDEEQENVKVNESNGRLEFKIYQGSKRIVGHADVGQLKAEAKVALTDDLNIGFLRRMVEQNFQLQYCRYALDKEDNITIVFDTYTLDSSPYKLYYALKEMALNADKQDDLLIEEFEMLAPVNIQHIEDIPEAEKELKYTFISNQIQKVLFESEEGKLNAQKYPGAIAYLVLGLCYKLDYLISPQGFMTDTLERVHRQYFEASNKTVAQKNLRAQRNLGELLNRDKVEYFKEMYHVISTFGITVSASHDQLVNFIDGELPNMDWYKDNGHEAIALSITDHIAGFCLFNYALPHPDKDLLQLYFHVVENDFFKSMGYKQTFYSSESKKLKKTNILEEIETLKNKHARLFPNFSPEVKLLVFTTLPDFAKSYFLMLRGLDVTKAV